MQDVLFPMGSMTVLPAQAMLESGSVGAAIELLQGTPYYETLSFAMKRYSAEQNLFPLEVALDLYYWRQLWQEAKKLQGQDREQASRIIGSLMDVNNLMWVIRYKVYHQLSEEEVINYTLPFGFRVRDEDVRAIAAGADLLVGGGARLSGHPGSEHAARRAACGSAQTGRSVEAAPHAAMPGGFYRQSISHWRTAGFSGLERISRSRI